MEKSEAEHVPAESALDIPPAEVPKDDAPESENDATVADKKLASLRLLLEKDLLAADVKWSLFVAACQHYRHDTCLKPFPPKFLKEDSKDIDSLRDVVDRTPSLKLLSQILKDPDVHQLDPNIVDLLHWVLKGTQQLKRIPKKQFSSVLSLVKCDIPYEPPAHIFSVTLSEAAREAWSDLSAGRKTLFAFHGSRLENFYSIVQYGLQQLLNKNSLFGSGIYLSTEMSMSLPYSPTGYGWGKSILGPSLSIVALCEAIDHPDVHYPRPVNKSGAAAAPSRKKQKAPPDSIGGEVPEKYILVTNSDLVRVRYLLVYNKPQASPERVGWTGITSWVQNHKLLTFIMGYCILLVSVGLSNNQVLQRHLRLLFRRPNWNWS
ncbi:protein mono-ADP-ribosyltransferase PARP16 [Schistocerca serialis cubense]|uniref:protein mono-ADP-ribosyltransferase PARP16 n=1 Tax=Schistocerca serialis cubense TaxID=2023355 RepID=UPI00214E58E5|nr:protein mono-ADP-ribosyltransferase PARP16 [Schistocerca serialis cubense]